MKDTSRRHAAQRSLRDDPPASTTDPGPRTHARGPPGAGTSPGPHTGQLSSSEPQVPRAVPGPSETDFELLCSQLDEL